MPIKVVIVELGGRWFPPGTYLKSFDHEANGGDGDAEFTDDAAEAMVFTDIAEAFSFYRRVPANKTIRKDGQPNRPLAATTIAFEEI